MLRTFQRLPHRFGGRIAGSLYYGAYVKVLLDADASRATVTFFGGEKVCHSKVDLERTVQKALREARSDSPR